MGAASRLADYTLFDTTIGRCGIAWDGRGIVAVQLPEKREAGTVARLCRRNPGAGPSDPPLEVRRAIAGITALLRGEASDLSGLTLDMEGIPPFECRVYEVTRTIPRGETLSYGEVAARLGSPAAARAVGRALGRNPFALIVPCHRVVGAGEIGGFSASGGEATKRRLLSLEAGQFDLDWA